MKRPKWIKLALVAMIGVPVALAIPALPAIGQSSPPVTGVRLSGTATIADRGAVAFTGVLIACPAGDQASVTAQLTERSGNGIAQGFGSVLATCNGNIQTVKVTVTPQNKPFVVGTAFGQASIFACDVNGCNSNTDARNVKLKLKLR